MLITYFNGYILIFFLDTKNALHNLHYVNLKKEQQLLRNYQCVKDFFMCLFDTLPHAENGNAFLRKNDVRPEK